MRVHLLWLIGALLFITGCTPKITMAQLEPAQATEAAKVQKLSVNTIKEDHFGFSSILEAELTAHTLQGSPYFTLIDRRDLKLLLDEQLLNRSGYVDEKDALKLGKITGIEALITGQILDASHDDQPYFEERDVCKRPLLSISLCQFYVRQEVQCTARTYRLKLVLKMIDVENARHLYAKTFSHSLKRQACLTQGETLPTHSHIFSELSTKIAKDFIKEIAPTYRSIRVPIFDQPDIEYSYENEKLLEQGVHYLERGRLTKAFGIFKTLAARTEHTSYVPLYNMGLIREALEDFKGAYGFYQEAHSVATSSVDAIDEALIRLEIRIPKHRKASQQINHRH